MSSWTLRAKEFVERLPYSTGRFLSRVPFTVRLGPSYPATRKLMLDFNRMDADNQRSWILSRLQEIVSGAYDTIPFYRRHYKEAGYDPNHLTSLEHFKDVPVVTKADLRSASLEDRSLKSAGRMLLNTGGTSGEPLEFHVDRSAFAREWAHMHWIWRRQGYRPSHVKLTLRGRNLGEEALRYNAVHNEFLLNSYASDDQKAQAVTELMGRVRVDWIHGYPSLIADFADHLRDQHEDLSHRLSGQIRGALLGSEFPAPRYRSKIEETLSERTVAWYGHSEMCVLAYEEGENRYFPLHTYGYCEAVPFDEGEHLVGTSYWNTAGPLIRYDTGDLISTENRSSPLNSFSVEDARTGEFVVDARGERISLTALIFGRHHEAFEQLSHLQVRQVAPGHIELLLVPRTTQDAHRIHGRFDFSGTDFQVDYRFIESPYRTKTGKIRLLVE